MKPEDIQKAEDAILNHVYGPRDHEYFVRKDEELTSQKPVGSDKIDPFRFFRTFLENRKPYIFLNEFYVTIGSQGYIDFPRERVLITRKFNDGTSIPEPPVTYVQYVQGLFSTQVDYSKNHIDVIIFENEDKKPQEVILKLKSKLEALIKKERKGAFEFSVTNVLGESGEVRDVFIESVQSLLNYLNKRQLEFSNSSGQSIKVNGIKKRRQPKPVKLMNEYISSENIADVETDLNSLAKIGYFIKSGDNYIFDQESPYLAAIIERWKMKKWLKIGYCGYKFQRELCFAACESYGLKEKRDTVYNSFKKSYLFGDTAETTEELDYSVKANIAKIERGLKEL